MSPRFAIGERVRVRTAHPPGHVRTPFFCRGKEGVVTNIVGVYGNPETLAYGGDGTPTQPLYWVEFHQTDMWPDYAGPPQDTLVVDLNEHWLEPA